MKFTVRFHDHVRNSIERILNQHIVPKTTIEIGCFEGETTFAFAEMMFNHNNKYKHYAIDPFGESGDLPADKIDEVKETFLKNLEEFTPGVVEHLHKRSFDGLVELYNRGIKADLIYVDGDHRAPGVLEDCVLGFKLLNVNGVMLFDDCVSWRYKDNITDSPKIAVDNFIQCYWNKLRVIEMPTGYQTAIVKTSE